MSKEKGKNSATVTLGGKPFTVQAAPMRVAKAWRQKFNEPLQIIIGILKNAGDIEINNVQDAAGILQQVGGLLLGSVDLLTDSLFEYSHELRANQDWILDHATDEEALTAVWEVVKLAYPFGSLTSQLQSGLANGQRMIGTMKS